MTLPRIMFYDLETTDLDADFGNLVAFGWKVLGEKDAHVLSLLDTNKVCKTCGRVDAVDDKPLVVQAHKILSSADMWVTWYGKGFDAKFINTRILDAKLEPLPDIPHVDLYWTARGKLKLSSNRLASVQNFLQLPTAKTPITKRAWRRAQAGDVKSIEYIVEHCEKDVDVLEQAYERLRPYVSTHPRVNGVDPCRVCGGNVQRRGTALTTLKGPRMRVQCTECAHWETRQIPKVTPRRAA